MKDEFKAVFALILGISLLIFGIYTCYHLEKQQDICTNLCEHRRVLSCSRDDNILYASCVDEKEPIVRKLNLD